MSEITNEMIAVFKRAAFDRMMHEDGCPEGEGIRAGLEAIFTGQKASKYEESHGIKIAENEWVCPNGTAGCTRNCGNYGCGN